LLFEMVLFLRHCIRCYLWFLLYHTASLKK
jgi:hypothetical protein